MIRIGILGVGHLGSIHIDLLKKIPHFEIVGFFDLDDEKAKEASEKFNIKKFSDLDELINECDAIDVVTPTLSHYELAQKVIKKGKHIFVEKPLTHTAEQAKELIQLVKESGIKAQVGHVERFNPAFTALRNHRLNPMFIEAHRLAAFNPRGTDVPVVLDLMIHDIDVILKMVNANVKHINANGVTVVSETPDIANARIEFDNGCVANLTSSRISLKKMRKMRVFQKDTYITMDFLEKKTQIFMLTDTPTSSPYTFEMPECESKSKRYIQYEDLPIEPVNAIQKELELFAESIVNDTEPPVTFLDGYAALNIAYQILDKIQKNSVSS